MELTRQIVEDWLLDNNRDRQWLADKCKVGITAVGNWLNKKNPRPIPAKAIVIIQQLMAADNKIREEANIVRQNLVLEFEDEVFSSLENKALEAQQTVRQWASETLKNAALLDEVIAKFTPEIIHYDYPLVHLAAGSPITADLDEISLTEELGANRYVGKLHGDSMAPKYPDDSTVTLRVKDSLKNPILKKGEIYDFSYRGERTLKVYNTREATQEEIDSEICYTSNDGSLKVRVLQSLNPKYPEIVINGDYEWHGWLDRKDS